MARPLAEGTGCETPEVAMLLPTGTCAVPATTQGSVSHRGGAGRAGRKELFCG